VEYRFLFEIDEIIAVRADICAYRCLNTWTVVRLAGMGLRQLVENGGSRLVPKRPGFLRDLYKGNRSKRKDESSSSRRSSPIRHIHAVARPVRN